MDFRRNGRAILSAAELLEGQRRVENIGVSAPEIAFRYLLAKKVLKGTILLGQSERLRLLVEQLAPGVFRETARLFGSGKGSDELIWSKNRPFNSLFAMKNHYISWESIQH